MDVTSTPVVPRRPVDLDKPRFRGWLHTYAFFVAAAAGGVLCAVAATRPGVTPLLSTLVYSATVCGLFGVSALYHRRVWSPRGYQVMRRLDHSMIFVLIAGTYTPFAVLLLSPPTDRVILAIIWGGALLGVAMKLIWPHAPRWLSAPLYMLLGWVAVAVLPDLLRAGGVAAFTLIVIGGLVYSAGAVLYALRRPNPWPSTFGHHEFFHACTLVAAACHYVAVYLALLA